MKAAFYCRNGGPEVLTYEDLPDPSVWPTTVLIRVSTFPSGRSKMGLTSGHVLNRVSVQW